MRSTQLPGPHSRNRLLVRGVLGSVAVLLGGLVTSALPDSTPLLGLDGLQALRGHPAGRMLGLAVVMAGLGLLGAAWLGLCRQVARDVDPDSTSDGVALARTAAMFWSVPLLLAPPLFSRDGWSYAAQGVMTRVGLSPYDFGPAILSGPIVEAVDPRWSTTLTPYGPLPLLLGAVASEATTDPWLLVVAHRVVALVGLAMLAWAVPRLARWTGVNPALATAIVVASPLMVAHGVGGVHNDLLMVGQMAVALVLAAERGWPLAAVAGGLAAAVKLPGGLVCIGVALVSLPVGVALVDRLRRLVAVALLAVATLAVLGAVTGLGFGWLRGLGVPGTVNTPLSLPTVLGGFLDLLAGWLGADPPPAVILDAVRTLASVVALAVAVVVALRWRTGSPVDGLRAVALIMAVLLVCSPVVHLWYFLWLVPFAAALRLGPVATRWLVAVSVIGGLVAPLDSSLHGAYLAIVIGVLIAAGLTVVLLLTGPSRARVARIADRPALFSAAE